MSVQRTINDIKVLVEPNVIFDSDIETGFVELKNYKYVDFLVCSGAGTAANTTVTINAQVGVSGSLEAVAFTKKVGNSFVPVEATGDTLSIGGLAGSCGKAIYRVDADSLAKGGFDRVSLCTTAVASSTVPGAIIVCKYEPRYTE